MSTPRTSEASPLGAADDFRRLFEALPIGAYRSLPGGRQLRANPALVRLNGYEDEAQMLEAVRDIATEWYVRPDRRDEFRRALHQDGQVRGFVSEIYRHRTRERIWVSENAYVVRDAVGQPLYYEGTVEEVTERVRAAEALARSEAHLRQVADRIPGMVYRVHADAAGVRRYSFVSQGVTKLFGITPQQVMADPALLASFIHPEDEPRVQAAVREAYARRQSLELEHRVVRRGGEVRWIRMISSEVESVEDGFVRVGVTLDVTERQLALAALRESDARWKLALDSIGDGVWDWDIASGREVLSDRCKEIYGLVHASLPEHHRSLDDRTHPDDVPRMAQDRQAHFDGRTPMYVNEHRVRHVDGSWRWVLSRGMVISRDEHGRPLRMIGTHTDITERKQAEALRAERDQAAAAQAAMTQFLSRLSHELRTPLNAILGFTQVMQADGRAPQTHQAWLTEVMNSGRHLLGLVDDLLDLSGAQGGQLAFDIAPMPLWPVLQECLAMLAQDAVQRGLVIECDAGLPSADPVLADRLRLKQIISNLLSNAIKYNRPGGRLLLDARRDGGLVALSVTDTGEGLTADQVARLFTPFERLEARHKGVPGTGLGLSLSRQLARGMGGDIVATSSPGRGSTFTLLLPAAALG